MCGKVRCPVGQPHDVEQFAGPGEGHRSRRACQQKGDGHVLQRAQRRDEVECLEHEADLVPTVVLQLLRGQPRHVDIAERYPARRRGEDATETRKQRCLAGARRAEEHDKLARFGDEIKTVERSDGVTIASVLDDQLVDAKRRWATGPGHVSLLPRRRPTPDRFERHCACPPRPPPTK